MFDYHAAPPAYDHTREDLWVERMGEERGKEFSHMMHERKRLHNVFTELLVLIRFEIEADHEKSMALHSFTSMVREAFWREVLVGLCKYGDRSNGRAPISLVSWRSHYAKGKPKAKKAEVQACVEEFFKALEPIRELRNSHLAHSDSQALTAEVPNSVSLDQVANALGLLADSLRAIERLNDLEPLHDLPYASSLGGAESFVNMIKNSKDHY